MNYTLGDYDIWYLPCERCGYDTGKSTLPKEGNKTCWRCGEFIKRDYSNRALKKPTTMKQMNYEMVLSAGICDTCSIPKMINTGDGVNEPLDPILYCQKMKREICPEQLKDRIFECRFYTC